MLSDIQSFFLTALSWSKTSAAILANCSNDSLWCDAASTSNASMPSAAVLILGYAGYWVLFAEDEYRRLTVASVAGEVIRTSPSGTSAAAGAGDFITASSQIRVGASGHAVLKAGEGTQLVLEKETSVRVLSADRRGVEVELDEGRVKARVQPGSRVLGVRAGPQEARTSAGAFQVARDGEGYVQVAAEQGTVEVIGPDGPTALTAGQRLDGSPTGRPSITDALLEEILLEVRWADPMEGGVPIEGRTIPYAQVAVDGPEGRATTRADGAGAFSTSVPIPPGTHTVRVEVSDSFGAEAAQEQVVERAVAVPVATTEVKFGG